MSRPLSIRTGLAILAIALCSASAVAQTPAVVDPRIVEFDPSPDHSANGTDGQPIVTRYDLELYLVGGTQPVQVAALGKPAPQTDGKIRVDFTTLLTPWPAPGTTYEARVAAVGPAGVGRSTESNTFAFSSPCSSAISPTSVAVNGQASTGSVTVSAVTGCAWTATSNASWLTITSGATGAGNGSVAYSVAANTTASQRTGALTIAGQTFTVTQSAGCSYTISPTATSVSASASTGSVSVTSTSGCAWTASSSASWITITSGASGSGSGTVGYSIAANTGTTQRTGTLTIAGRTFTVTQDAPVPCTFSISPVNTSIGATAATGTITVTAGSGCAWTASSSVSWITVTAGASGSGNGQVSYSVAANPGTTSRTGTITVGGQTFTVTQAGQTCTFALSPVSTSISSDAATGTLSVDTLTGCSWSATASASWISITSGSSGTGDGTVGYSIAANTSLSSRTGTVTVGGQAFTVTQAGVVCTATLAPVSTSVNASGGPGSVTVTLPSVCPWTASSAVSWVTITSGASGTGNGSVGYTVAANTSTSPRSGTLTIAGQTFNVSQTGASCTYSASPTAASAPAGAGTGTVTVTSASGCAWTASSSVSWITITTGASGSGSGTVTYSFVANPTTQSRAGVLTVAGQAVTVTQAAGCGYSISPTTASVSSTAGSGSIAITAGAGCSWTAQSPVSWITFSTATSGTSNGSVGYVVAANNNSASRSATLTVAGQGFVLTQAGAPCDATLTPATQNVAAAGANGSVDVAMPGGCAWSAVSSVSWITVLTGASGTGNGTVTYRVDPNPAGSVRTGTIAVGGRSLTVTQAAAPCTATLSSTTDSLTSTGGTRVVSVTIPTDCSWSATSNASWITVTAGGGPNTSGSGAVTFSVAANTSTSSRTGTLTIAGVTFTVTQAGVPCSYTVSPTATSVTGAAGTGTVTVTTAAGCNWTASSAVSWMSITNGASGTGSGTVTYSFTANPNTTSRSGVLTVAGQAVTVTQFPGCGYGISPASASLTASAGTGTIAVTSGLGCFWSTQNTASWVTFSTPTTGTGNGSIGYNVAANTTSSSRSTTLTVAGLPFVITQAGAACDAVLTPSAQNIAAGGEDGSVDVTVPAGCAWTAVSGVSWITVLTGASGSGDGTITYRVAANPAGTTRTGTVAIAGRLLTVTQAAAPCTASLSSTSESLGSAGGTRVVSVTIPTGCPWGATSNASWITVTAGAGPNSSGNGGVTFSVAANTSTTPRTGTLTIAGLTLTVSQSGVTCNYTVTPTSANASATGGTDAVSVTSVAGCAWTATSAVSWMSVTSGASGSGSGSVSYSVAANPTTQSRSGVLTVAGQAVTITQAAGCGYAISPASASLAATAATGTITVTAGGSCTWTAQSPVSWVTFTTSSSGTGDGSVGYAVEANPDSASRSVTLTVAGQSHVITQAGAPCTPKITPNSDHVPPGQSKRSATVELPTGCKWTATSSVSWITLDSGVTGEQTGSGSIGYTVEANVSGTARVGTIAVAGQLLTITQDGAPCTASLSTTTESFEAPGGNGIASVTIPSGCVWTAASNTAWISVTSGAGPNSSGNGGVTYAVSANTSTAPRTGTLTIAGLTLTVAQAGTCDISVSPSSVSSGSDASSGSVTVTAASACSWTATSSVSWLTVTSGGTGSGDGIVQYAMAANTSNTARTGSLTIGGRVFSVTQAAPLCSVVLSTTSVSLTSAPAFRSVNVGTGSGCAWTATSSVAWITIASGASGTGNGAIAYSVAANTSTTPRTGTITVGGESLTVTQAGAACSYSLTPTSISISAAGTAGAIDVSSSPGCAWTASSSVSWITIGSGSSGDGDGTVQYTVAPNTASFSRVGTLVVAGRSFTVSQAGSTCTSSLTSTGVSVGPAATSAAVGILMSAECSWTASPSVGWISVVGASTGTGSATVSLAIAQNTSSASRSGSVAIAGRTYTVTQSGACTYSTTPTGVNVNGGSTTSSVWVTAGLGCSWTAQSPVSWITLSTSGGSGAGIVGLTITPNPTSSPRSATLTIAENAVLVTQAGAVCNIMVSPVSLNVVGGTRTITVTAPTGCTWSATSTVSWMTFPNAAAGNGNGTLEVSFAQNTTGMSRIGFINLGGWRIFVTQRMGTAPSPPEGMRIVGQ